MGGVDGECLPGSVTHERKFCCSLPCGLDDDDGGGGGGDDDVFIFGPGQWVMCLLVPRQIAGEKAERNLVPSYACLSYDNQDVVFDD